MRKLGRSLLSIVLVVCLLLSLSVAALGASYVSTGFTTSSTYSNQFTDVKSTDWYQTYVKSAYELNLIKGTSNTKFSPTSNLTIAQAIALAARIHNIYYGGSGNFTQTGTWYDVYVTYAINNNIITSNQYANYNTTATRLQFAQILAAALPDSALTAINNVVSLPDTSIPTAAKASGAYAAVYKLYNAGVLTGSDSKGTFNPTNNIKRSEVAAIVVRMVDTSLRQTLSYSTTTLELDQIVATMYAGDTLQLTATIKPTNVANNYAVTWTSSNTNVARVNNGLVTAVASGSATITASISYGTTTRQATCVVTVNDKKMIIQEGTSRATSVNASGLSKKSMVLGGNSVKLTATEIWALASGVSTTEKAKADSATITWTIASTTVSNMVNLYNTTGSTVELYALKAGTAVLKATSSTGASASITITVYERDSAISLSATSLTLGVDGTSALRAIDLVDGGTLTWKSSDTSVVYLSSSSTSSGSYVTLTARKVGSATITVTSTSSGATATCTVSVQTSTVSITPQFLTFTSTSSSDYKRVTATDSVSSSATITWTVADSSVVTLSASSATTSSSVTVSSGAYVSVIPKAAGATYITAKSSTGAVNYISVSVSDATLTVTPSVDTIKIGGTTTLKATSSTGDTSFNWTSSNTNVATVSNGVVTGRANGTATITASLPGTSKTASATITVQDWDFSFSSSSLSLGLNDTALTNLIINGSYSGTSSVTLKSSDTTIATVDSSVTLSGGKAAINVTAGSKTGTATITATIGTVSKTFTVTVSNVDAVSITADSTALVVLDEAEDPTPLSYTVTPTGAAGSSITWKSSNTSIATVESGVVTGHAAGTAIITATCKNGTSATWNIKVADIAPTSVTISGASNGDKYSTSKSITLTATVSPTNATTKTVTWASDNESVAAIDASTGKITVKGAGTATFTATVKGYTAVNKSVTLTFYKPITSITLKEAGKTVTAETLTITETMDGRSCDITAVVTPTDATDIANNNLIWVSSDENVAVVDPTDESETAATSEDISGGKIFGVNATITGVADGTATITCYSGSDLSIKAQITITVQTPVRTVDILDGSSSDTMTVGSTENLLTEVYGKKITGELIDAKVTPTAGIYTYTWTSSNTSVATVAADSSDNSKALVTALKAGTTTITVTVKDKSGNVLAKDTFTITVS